MAVARTVMDDGLDGTYDGRAIREVVMATLRVASPRDVDPIITRYASPERLEWMHRNFFDTARVGELGDADSYATRLYDYARSGRNQLDWVVARLRADRSSRSATITTFQPLTDTSYIPCVSLLDFFIADGCLQLVVYAHSIDFGTKGYANLVELAWIQGEVSQQLDAPLGGLTMIVKSAHIYEGEFKLVDQIVGEHFGR